MTNREVPAQVQKSLDRWNTQSTFLQYAYITLLFVSISASVAVAAAVGEIPNSWVKLISFVAAMSGGLMGGFNLKEKANEMRNAYSQLRTLVLRYEHVEAYGVDVLIRDYDRLSQRLGEIRGKELLS